MSENNAQIHALEFLSLVFLILLFLILCSYLMIAIHLWKTGRCKSLVFDVTAVLSTRISKDPLSRPVESGFTSFSDPMRGQASGFAVAGMLERMSRPVILSPHEICWSRRVQLVSLSFQRPA